MDTFLPKFIPGKGANVAFEDNKVGRMKKEIADASDEQVDKWLAEYGVPSKFGWGTPGMYIQTTINARRMKELKKNDVVLIPIGCTEVHGPHSVSAMDTLFVTCLCERVRYHSIKQGRPVAIALPPLFYGAHPLHHLGMPGTVVIHEDNAINMIKDVMFGLWNAGYRKQILVNNHGHMWMVESALQRFCKDYQLPGIYRCLDWQMTVRELMATKTDKGDFESAMSHADEVETSVGLLMFPEMVDMSLAVDDEAMHLLPLGHFDTGNEAWRRPSRWSQGEGHQAMEVVGTPSGVVGYPTRASAQKAKRPVLGALRYLTMLIDEYLEAYPPGKVPDAEIMTLRSNEEMAPYLKEPLSKGWKSIYGLHKCNY